MEELFVGNSVILLFWVYISFIIDIDEYYKKIILMYLITYIANVLNIVPTFQSYEILLLQTHHGLFYPSSLAWNDCHTGQTR